jgi:hypothetical protein
VFVKSIYHQHKKRGGKEMKKFIVLGLFGLLIMAFSATVYAQPKLEFKASGSFQATTWLYRNISPGDGFITSRFDPVTGFSPKDAGIPQNVINWATTGAWDRTNSYWEYRGILRFDAIMGKELSGTVIFEIDSTRWGDNTGGLAVALVPAGVGIGGLQRGTTGFWTADRSSVEVKNLYFDAALPYFGIPAPMNVRVGIQPLGVRPHMFMSTDGAGVTGGIKIDPVMIGLTYAKAWEGRDATSDDWDVYGGNINAKLGPITPGFFAYNFNMNAYPSPQTANGFYGGLPGGILPPPLGPATQFVNFTSNMWWIGAYLDGKLGPINLNFDVVFDTGKVKVRDNVNAVWRDVKYNGWAGQLKLEYPWEKFNFGAVGMYASGADLKKTSTGGLPGQAVADAGAVPAGTLSTKVGSYVIPPGSEEWAAWGESLILSNNYITATSVPLGLWPRLNQYPGQMTRGAIGGTSILKLFAGFKPISWYKVTFQGMYIWDTTSNGNTLGDACRPGLVGTGGNPVLRDDKGIGWEFDLLQDIQIYANLKWSIGLGYLVAGKALDQQVKNWTGLVPTPTLGAPTYRNASPKDPWILATMLRYDF